MDYMSPDKKMENEKASDNAGGNTGAGVISRPRVETQPQTKKPALYKVLLLNDDYTPMEFVVFVLEQFFQKGKEDAVRLMLQVHQNGMGICGIFTFEVAESKVKQVMDCAKENEHPLQCAMEKA